MKPLPADPLELVRPLVAGIGGWQQTDQVRRGLWVHATTPRPPVGTTPHEIIHRQNKLCVRYYAPATASTGAPVVVVPSMINKASICDLEPDRSLVASLAEKGHPTYLVDWGVPTDEDALDSVAHVLLTLLHRSIDRVRRHAGAHKVFLLGYCQGGTLAAMYAALRPARVAGLATFTAPVRFSAAGRFRRFVDPAAFDVDSAIPADRLLPVSVMQSAFKLLDPMGNWGKFIALDEAAQRPDQLARALARERWLEENVPMPGTFAREFIRRAYQEDALLAGTWTVGDETVDLRNWTGPLLVVAARKDFIAPLESVAPLATATGSTDATLEVLETGHIGIVVGTFGPRVFFPLLDRWFRERAALARPAPGAAWRA